jgi:hypothetical protein
LLNTSSDINTKQSFYIFLKIALRKLWSLAIYQNKAKILPKIEFYHEKLIKKKILCELNVSVKNLPPKGSRAIFTIYVFVTHPKNVLIVVH